MSADDECALVRYILQTAKNALGAEETRQLLLRCSNLKETIGVVTRRCSDFCLCGTPIGEAFVPLSLSSQLADPNVGTINSSWQLKLMPSRTHKTEWRAVVVSESDGWHAVQNRHKHRRAKKR